MTETLCDSGAVKLKAGSGAATYLTNSATAMTQFINQAEGFIAVETRNDWVSKYGGLSANFKQILEGAASDRAAIYVINSNMSGYTSRAEAITMLNVLYTNYQQAIKVLNDDKVKTFMGA